MNDISFSDGIVTLLLLQAAVIGVLLLSDRATQNKFLGAFIIIFAINSSRSVLYKLVEQSAFLDIYVSITWAGFYAPLLFLFIKSHVREIDNRSILSHFLFPTMLSAFSLFFGRSSYRLDLLTMEVYYVISYGSLSSLFFVYVLISQHFIRHNQIWISLLKSVRLKIQFFVFGILIYLFLVSIQTAIVLVFDIQPSPGNSFYIFQNIVFHIILAIIPIYSYTVLSRFKKFIQPKHINAVVVDENQDLKNELDQLFNKDKIHTRPDLNPSLLSNMLSIPIQELRTYFKYKHQKSIGDFITEKRLETFIELAKNDTKNLYNIEGIALNAGFKSKPTFYRSFKRVYGVSPAEYLEDMK